jgi:hypothetical protein
MDSPAYLQFTVLRGSQKSRFTTFQMYEYTRTYDQHFRDSLQLLVAPFTETENF